MPSLTSADATERFRRPPDRFLDVGAGEVAYRRVGTGPDVLFVHGWPVSGATFRHLLPHLAWSVTCHVIDLPGAGSSRFGPDTELSVEGHIRSVRKVVDQLGLDDVAVVGHDSGGLVARHALGGDERGPEHGPHRHGASGRAELALPLVPGHPVPARRRGRPRLGRRAAKAQAQRLPARRRVRRPVAPRRRVRRALPPADPPRPRPGETLPSACCAASTTVTWTSWRASTSASRCRCGSSGESRTSSSRSRGPRRWPGPSPTPPSPSSRALGCSATRNAPPRSPPRCCRSSPGRVDRLARTDRQVDGRQPSMTWKTGKRSANSVELGQRPSHGNRYVRPGTGTFST